MTTFLSTRHLLADPDPQSFHGHGGTTRAGVESKSQQPRSISSEADDPACTTSAPSLIEPGDAAGNTTVSGPVRFRWTAVSIAEHYHFKYSVDAKKEVDIHTEETEQTLTFAVGSQVRWHVEAHNKKPKSGPGGGCDGVASSGELRFRVTEPCTPPSITQQPDGKTISSGTSTTLTVAASGTALTYEWFRGTTKVGSGPSFNTGNLTETTTYRVMVSNDCGTVTSNDVTVTVTPACEPPSIPEQPAGKSIVSGTSATLTVIASGSALTYEWFRGTMKVGTGSQFNTGTLTETTTYRVVISNACGSVTSNDVTVTVTPACVAPSITQQPAAKSIVSGTSATLTVAASGSALTYEWLRGTTKVGTGSQFNTGTLTETTTYRVVISNACGSVTSNDVTVTVTAACVAPSITAQPGSVSIAKNDSVLLTVSAAGTGLSYQWYRGSIPVGTNRNSLDTGALAETATFRVIVSNACGSVTSRDAIVTVSNVTPVCRVLTGAPRIAAVLTAYSDAPYTIQWSAVEQAGAYDIQESATPDFANATTLRASGLFATYRKSVNTATSFYYRVRAVNACDQSTGPFSGVVRIGVLPKQTPVVQATPDLITPFGRNEEVIARVKASVDRNAATFSITASEPWIRVTPSAGSVPPSGELELTLTADPRSLPNGTSMASLHITTSGSSARGISSSAATKLTLPVSISLVTPIMPAPPASGGEVLILPAVAHADGNNSTWQSDVRIAHTYPQAVKYLLTFTPSGADLRAAVSTEMNVDAGQTIALDDILGRWFGAGVAAGGATGALEIRTLTSNLGSGRTLATSRLFNVAPNGSFGQFIAAVPLAKFLGSSNGATQTLVALSQSDRFRTNLGVVEGSGKPADVLLEVFSASGTKLLDTLLHLQAGEHRQIGALLSANGIAGGADLTNARVDVKLVSQEGSVFSYASVIDNETGDPSFVPAQTEAMQARRYTIAGVANLDTAGGGKWQSDVRLFNGGAATATATLELFVQGQSTAAATRTVDVAAGQMLVLDDVVQSVFGMPGSGGALRITTPTDTALVPAARRYHKRDSGTYGQFISAATDENTTSLGNEPLRILQVEESARFRTNVGLAETTGRPVTVEITASLPNSKIAAVSQFDMPANDFRQLNGLLRSMGLDDAYNATVTVRVIGGEGRVLAYGSVIDNATQDPTYVMGY